MRFPDTKQLFSFLKTPLFFLLLFSFVARLSLFFFYDQALWWDEAVYIGMGKYLYSFGSAGLFEHIRPLGLPLILGLFWLINESLAFLFGYGFILLCSVGSIFFVYAIGKKLFGEWTGLFGASVFSFSSIYFFMTPHLYTEIPSTFFVVAALYLLLYDRFFFSGIFLGLGFLTKFPVGIYLPLFCLYFFTFTFKNRKTLFSFFTSLAWYVFGFLVVAVPYLFFNFFSSGTFFGPLHDAKIVINNVLGCNVLWYKPWHYYLELLFFDHYLGFFFLLGILFLFLKRPRVWGAFLLCFIVPLLYLMLQQCRDARYFIMVLPFFSLLVGYGIFMSSHFAFDKWMKGRRRGKIFFVILLVIIIFGASQSLLFFSEKYYQPPSLEKEQALFFADKEIAGGTWSASPFVAAWTSQPVEKLYYPVYGEDLALSFLSNLKNDVGDINYVLLDNCAGGMICPKEDAACFSTTEEIMTFLHEHFLLAFNETRGACSYLIYERMSK